MDAIVSALQEIMQEKVNHGLHNQLYEATVGYIMQVHDYARMKQLIKPFDLRADQHIRLRAQLSQQYTLALGLKIAIINFITSGENTLSAARRACRVNDIPTDNAVILRNLERCKNYRAICRKIKQIDNTAITAPYIHNVIAEREFKNLSNHIKFACRRKLTFICKSNNMRPEDLEDEVRELLLFAFYKIVPFVSDLHRSNFLKKSLHNIVLKRLSFYNSLKRQRLKGSGDINGYSMTIESISHNDQDDENSSVMLSSATLPTETILNDLSIDKYIQSGPIGRKRIVDLLTLRSQEVGFVNFARANANIRSIQDCEDVLDKVGYSEYYNLIAGYLAVPSPVIERVRKELSQIVLN